MFDKKLSVNPNKRQGKVVHYKKANQLLWMERHLESMKTPPFSKLLCWHHKITLAKQSILFQNTFFLVLRCCFVFPVQVHRAQGWQEGEVVLCSKTAAPHVIISAASLDQDCDLA